MLQDYCNSVENPDKEDSFPELGFNMTKYIENTFDLFMLTGKNMYTCSVKELKRTQLSDRADTMWEAKMAMKDTTQPVRRVF